MPITKLHNGWRGNLLKKKQKEKKGEQTNSCPTRTYVEPKHIREIYKIRIRPGTHGPCRRYEMEQTSHGRIFYMSNICPQNPNLNRGDWNDLEEKSRQWAKKYGAVYIACGPIYDTKRPKRIGNNKVAVPHAFYKVILINDKKNPQAIGFIFPNSAGHKPLKKYMVTVDSVEKRTDIDFFPALPDEIENRIEAELVQELL